MKYIIDRVQHDMLETSFHVEDTKENNSFMAGHYTMKEIISRIKNGAEFWTKDVDGDLTLVNVIDETLNIITSENLWNVPCTNPHWKP